MTRRLVRFAAVAAAILVLATGCGVRKTMVRSAMDPILAGGMDALMAEPDLELARTALASNLKLIEGMIREDPENTELLLYAAQGFAAYALAFVEDENPERAVELYRRAHRYANRALIVRENVDLLAVEELDRFEDTVARLDDDAVPGVFSLANAWGSEIMLSLDEIAAVSDLPRVEALMRFVLEVDEAYYFAGAHLFFGGYYGVRPPTLGGDLEKAERHLRRQIELTGGNVLLGRLFLVKYVHLRRLDEPAARAELNRILEFDVNQAPENTTLLNRVAQEKARRLLQNLDQYL